MEPPNWRVLSRAVVGMGVLRKGAVIRTGTATCIDVSGLYVTANHNIDRLMPGDAIVLAVPSISTGAAASVEYTATHGIDLIVPALGTYRIDVNERVAPGELRAFERSRWIWTHAARVVVETLHHEADDAAGQQGIDLAVIQVTHCVVVASGEAALPPQEPSADQTVWDATIDSEPATSGDVSLLK